MCRQHVCKTVLAASSSWTRSTFVVILDRLFVSHVKTWDNRVGRYFKLSPAKNERILRIISRPRLFLVLHNLRMKYACENIFYHLKRDIFSCKWKITEVSVIIIYSVFQRMSFTYNWLADITLCTSFLSFGLQSGPSWSSFKRYKDAFLLCFSFTSQWRYSSFHHVIVS